MSPSVVETPLVAEVPVETPVEVVPSPTEPVIESKGSSVEYLPLSHVEAAEMPASGATKLRKMIFETKELVVCPGVYDGLSARTAIETGFSAMYMVCSHPLHLARSANNLQRLVPVPLLPVLASPILPSLSSTR